MAWDRRSGELPRRTEHRSGFIRTRTASAIIMKTVTAGEIQTETVSVTTMKMPSALQIRMETAPATTGKIFPVLRLRRMELMAAGTDGIIRPAAEMDPPMDTDMDMAADKSRRRLSCACLRRKSIWLKSRE